MAHLVLNYMTMAYVLIVCVRMAYVVMFYADTALAVAI